MKKTFLFLIFVLMAIPAFALTSGKIPVATSTSSPGIPSVMGNSDITDILGTSVSVGVPMSVNGSLVCTLNGTNCPAFGGLGYTPAHSGSNSDITSLSGLTTPLSILQGGTGSTTGLNIGTTASTTVAHDSSSDIEDVPWQDYSASSTIVGWSSFTTKWIYYKKVGKTVFVSFYIQGTSNATTASFTLPYNSASAPFVQFSSNSCSDSVNSASSSNNDYIYYNIFNASIGKSNSGFTASGTKYIQGSFSYQST
jgi:hypothetical protein